MKKIIAISMIIAGTFAGAGIASASGSLTQGSYTGWAHDAFAAGEH